MADASNSSVYSVDPYIAGNQVKSVFCLPIVRQTELVGMLYLENNLLVGAFTPERLSLLELLASQAAISIENARLYADAQKAIQARETFVAVASHELRTPLTPLTLQIQMIRRLLRSPVFTNLAQSQNLLQAVDNSERQLRRLSRLVYDLLDVSRVSGGMTLYRETFDLVELTRSTIESLAIDLGNARCKVELHAESPVVGSWDRSSIESVLTNLLANAMKYGAGKPIVTTVFNQDGYAKFSVRDFGIGIPEEDQKRIFDRFERAVSIKSFGGLGLGLYIARQIVHAHGGAIRVESRPGSGATFTVELPTR